MISGLIVSDRMWSVARLATACSFFGGFIAVFLRCKSAESPSSSRPGRILLFSRLLFTLAT